MPIQTVFKFNIAKFAIMGVKIVIIGFFPIIGYNPIMFPTPNPMG